jgi:hypothetical protein
VRGIDADEFFSSETNEKRLFYILFSAYLGDLFVLSKNYSRPEINYLFATRHSCMDQITSYLVHGTQTPEGTPGT